VAKILLGGRTRSLRPLSIHRYHPKDDLSGMLGMLNFDRDRIAGLIDRGFTDAVEHDCDQSECLMPDGTLGLGGKPDYDVPFDAEH